MVPTVLPNDVLLVETLSPRLHLPLHEGDLVFFEPPPALQKIVAQRQEKLATANAAAAAQQGASSALAQRDGSTIATPTPTLTQLLPNRQLFVKRVRATAGAAVQVDRAGAVVVRNALQAEEEAETAAPALPPPRLQGLLQPTSLVVPRASYFVTGDNSEVSIDSRVWGTLPEEYVVGRPLLRVLPLQRFGSIR